MIINLFLTAFFCVSNLICEDQITPEYEVSCSASECTGFYEGPEFINGSDVAHQLSNKISEVVGDKLKELYKSEIYSKVDFSSIIMTTKGMDSGSVEFRIVVPFLIVKERCEAYTSFDHVGGWNHSPALESRKKQLCKLLLPGENLAISDLVTTPEGLQEYWIQWKNKTTQPECSQH